MTHLQPSMQVFMDTFYHTPRIRCMSRYNSFPPYASYQGVENHDQGEDLQPWRKICSLVKRIDNIGEVEYLVTTQRKTTRKV